MKKLILPIFFVALIYGYQHYQTIDPRDVVEAPINRSATANDSSWRSGSQVKGNGSVVRILSDDNDGSRHQRFILRLSSGRSVLIAHNIDLAPRVRSIAEGDVVSFYGQFESNPQGGVVHWTHKDPQGRHAHGWLEHRGNRYQ